MSITKQVYHILLEHYGRQEWWPAESPFEVVVGAVLVQNTAWKNVEHAIRNLRDANVLTTQGIAALEIDALAELIRPAGYFRIKAKRLRNLVDFIVGEFDGSLEAMRRADASDLRRRLLAVNGVGPETADSILLYALQKPSLVVDAYTLRIWTRHGWVNHDAGYNALQTQLTSELPIDTRVYNEMHALLVRVGHLHCRRRPQCEGCPLQDMLPPGGIVEL